MEPRKGLHHKGRGSLFARKAENQLGFRVAKCPRWSAVQAKDYPPRRSTAELFDFKLRHGNASLSHLPRVSDDPHGAAYEDRHLKHVLARVAAKHRAQDLACARRLKT